MLALELQSQLFHMSHITLSIVSCLLMAGLIVCTCFGSQYSGPQAGMVKDNQRPYLLAFCHRTLACYLPFHNKAILHSVCRHNSVDYGNTFLTVLFPPTLITASLAWPAALSPIFSTTRLSLMGSATCPSLDEGEIDKRKRRARIPAMSVMSLIGVCEGLSAVG